MRLYGPTQVPLPNPPSEWNVETHPFAVVTCNNYNNERSFVVSSTPCYASISDSGTCVLTKGSDDTTGQTYQITKEAPNEFALYSNSVFYGLMYDHVIWANFDIYTQNEDLYFPKCSDPAEATGYSPRFVLYNGVRAPVIQAWGKEKYEYALLTADGEGTPKLYLSTTPLLYKPNATLSKNLYSKADGELSEGWLNITLDNWEHYSEYELSYTAGSGVLRTGSYTPIWANYDLCEYENETNVILTASDPVPTSPVNMSPELLMQGLFVGQAVRRMRST